VGLISSVLAFKALFFKLDKIGVIDGAADFAEFPVRPQLGIEHYVPRLREHFRIFHSYCDFKTIVRYPVEDFRDLQLIAVLMANAIEPGLVHSVRRF